MLTLKILATAFTVFILFKIYISFKKRRLLTRSDLFFWIALWLTSLVFIFSPDISGYIARFLGMGRGIDSIFLLSIILNFYLIFVLYLKLDKTRQKLTELAINTSKEIHALKNPK